MKIIITTVSIAIVCNIIGFIYSYTILYSKWFNKNRLQSIKYKPQDFFERLPLIGFNIALLLALSIGGLWVAQDSFTFETPTLLTFAWQFGLFMLVDDVFFYFFHRAMHEVKFLYKKIHRIHHKAFNPIPLEYLYVHPLEWMGGTAGIAATAVFISLTAGHINAWPFWAFAIVRNLHELEIHSGLKSVIGQYIPFYGTTEHHDLHHAKLKGNYASTFSFWDKLLKTDLHMVNGKCRTKAQLEEMELLKEGKAAA
jgi:sterol desaturase/sphingolipid hydroxylase (fatty acid hydroxylase superfamily)